MTNYFDKSKMVPMPSVEVVSTSTETGVVQVTPIDINQYLSPHFQLKELIRTSQRGIDNTPPQEVLVRLTKLANDFLEPVRNEFGPLIITSGYRCPELNTKIGGSKESAHMFGCAADFMPFNKQFTSRDVVKWVKNSNLDFDQIIDEYGGKTSNWVHLGILRPNKNPHPRKEALLFKDGKYSIFV